MDLKIIVVIPVYNEYNITNTLESIFYNQKKVSFKVEIIALINNSSSASSSVTKTNQNTFNELKLFAHQNKNSQIHLIPIYINDLDPKHAGVGWARKLGGLALERFKNCLNGIIAGLTQIPLLQRIIFMKSTFLLIQIIKQLQFILNILLMI